MATCTKRREAGKRGKLIGTHRLKVLHSVLTTQRYPAGCGYISSSWRFRNVSESASLNPFQI